MMCKLSSVNVLLPILLTVATSRSNNIDQTKFDEGKRQFQLLLSQSAMPKFGNCWKEALAEIKEGCKQLTDVMQSRLALAYLNCFLKVQGRPSYPCKEFQSIESCTKNLDDSDRGSFTTFFTHTHSICYFLQSQVWHEETEKTITKLADGSKELASQLEESSKLQKEIVQSQNDSLKNQELILEKAVNLSKFISSSSENIHTMFDEFKKSTHEQRILINDVFDRVSKLQSTVIGEFSWFYSLVYYTLAVVVCYFITSTARTQNARFCLFGIMTLNLCMEKMLVYKANNGGYTTVAEEAEEDKLLYEQQWLCRKVSGFLGFIVLVIFAYFYEDINVQNNILLLEIRKQNAEIKHCLQGNQARTMDRSDSDNDRKMLPDSGGVPESTNVPETSPADTTGYESDSAVSSDLDYTTSSSVTTGTDHTYLPAVADDSDSDKESFISADSDGRNSQSRSSSSSIMRELRNLRNSTPVKELSSSLVAWATTGYYRHPDHDLSLVKAGSNISDMSKSAPTRSRGSTPIPRQGSSVPFQGPSTSGATHKVSRYNLRPRQTKSSVPNEITRTESPRSFTRTVKSLEKIAIRNRRLARLAAERENRLLSSTDEDL